MEWGATIPKEPLPVARVGTSTGRYAAMSPRGPVSIHQGKVTLEGITPPVWRWIQVASSITLRRLHDVIQATMGWTQSHLYEFEIGGAAFGEPSPGYDLPVRS